MSRARLLWVSGPVLRARADGPFRMREAVTIGSAGLLGEVVTVNGDDIVVQVYEDPTGLRPGVEVKGTGKPLGIALGPGLLGNIFDGLLRPLSGCRTEYIEPGATGRAGCRFQFEPLVEPGHELAGGEVFGKARSGEDRIQDCLLPPRVSGTVESIAGPGAFDEDAAVCRIRASGGEAHDVAMSHFWPVREPRQIGRAHV